MALDNQEELIEYDSWAVPLKSGAIWALIAILISLATYLTVGIETGMSITSVLSFIANGLLAVVMLYLAMKNHRDQNLAGFLSFGQGMVVGLKTTLIFTLLLIVYNFFFTTFIEPDLAKDIFAEQIEQLEEAGTPDEQIEMTEKMFKIFTNPLVMALMTLLYSFLMGIILSLLAAAIAKNERIGTA